MGRSTALSLTCVFILSACANPYQLAQRGQYAETAQELNKRAEQSPLEAGDHALLCGAYFSLRRYDVITSCLAEVEHKFQAKVSGYKEGEILHNRALSSLVYARIARANVLIDLGLYEEAANVAQQAKSTAGQIRDNFASRIERGRVLVCADAALAKLAYLNGDTKAGDAFLSELLGRQIDGLFGATPAHRFANTSAIHAHSTEFILGPNALCTPTAIRLLARRYDEVLSDLPGDMTPTQHRALMVVLGLAVSAIPYVGGGLGGGQAITDSFTSHLAEASLANSTFMRAKALLEVGRVDEAKPLHDRLLGFEYLPQRPAVFWVVLFDRGRIAEKEGKPDEAIEFYKRAIEVIERQRASIGTEASKIGFVGNKQAPYGRLVALAVAAGRHAEAFEYTERARSRALVDLLAERGDLTARPGVAPAAGEKIAALAKEEVELAALVPKEQMPEQMKKRSIAAETKAALQREAPEVASLVTVTASAPGEIQGLLAPGETLISYFAQGDALHAFVVSRGQVRALALDGKGLTEDITRLRKLVANPKSNDWRAPARTLHDRLIAPLGPWLAGDRLIVVPHGALHYLPFAALHSAEGPLIDKYALRMLPSGSVIRFLKSRRPGTAPILAFGNPDLGDPKLALEFAEVEARRVAALRSGSTVLVRRGASAKAFRTMAPKFRYIHFAGHAKFDPKAPLASGLHMAAADGTSGLLSAGDLYGLALDADLVTLSACDTGIGQLAAGDELIGLSRGFLYAGARNIVTTLWEVEDQTTAELMEAFYRAAETRSLDAALRDAQQTVRRRFPHPLFWAAFQITGRG